MGTEHDGGNVYVDLAIVGAYFVVIMAIGIRSRPKNDQEMSAEEFFLSSRSLRWPSIAISTIATNISAGHFITITTPDGEFCERIHGHNWRTAVEVEGPLDENQAKRMAAFGQKQTFYWSILSNISR